MNNLDIKNIIFEAIKSFGYKIIKESKVDGYFLWDGEENSVIHFYIKGIPHWKFGLWINSEYLNDEFREKEEDLRYDELYKVVQLFAQYDTCIDKFKPSYSEFLVEYLANEWNRHIDGTYRSPWYQIDTMLGMLKRHPLISYRGLSNTNKSYLLYFINEELINNRFHKLISKFMLYKSLLWLNIKLIIARKSKVIESITVSDFEKDNQGWKTNDRFKVNILFSESATEDEELKWLNFWFHKDNYGYSKYRFGNPITISDFKKVGCDEEYMYK